MSKIPHEDPYAGNPHVRFDEGQPPKNVLYALVNGLDVDDGAREITD